jgi:hypothetical protein
MEHIAADLDLNADTYDKHLHHLSNISGIVLLSFFTPLDCG